MLEKHLESKAPVTRPPGPPDTLSSAKGVPADPSGFSIVLVRDRAALDAHVSGWDDLASVALEPNAFYESWNVLPAFDAFGAEEHPLLAFVYGRPPGLPAGKPLCCGFFPLVRRRLSRFVPVRVLSMWQHRYCFLTTPLVRKGCGELVLAAFLDWARSAPEGGAIWELPGASAEGPFARLLIGTVRVRLRPAFVRDAFARATFEVPADLDAYLDESFSGRQRRDLRRRERVLAQRGTVQTRVLAAGDDPGPWLDQFLRLEALGWKGREGTALASSPLDERYFRAMATAAHARGRLHLLGLFQGGEPIAMKCNLLAPPGAFAFKIAFDEALAAGSPGVLLELVNMEQLCSRRTARWMDSCTAFPDHPMIDRLWLERRAIHTLLVATGRAPGDLVVSSLPLFRWLKRKVRR
jgi:hypothetical protein